MINKIIAMKAEQKLVSFTYHPTELDRITEEMKEGWSIVSLVKNGNYYVGIMEYNPNKIPGTMFVPPRKKIKIFS